ncbi:MAG: class I SAM-dependent methyltransferase [bacterium]
MLKPFPNRVTRCPVCRAANVFEFIEILNVPIHCNLLWSSRDEAARAARGDIRLGFCHDCGHVFNLAFNPAAMSYDQAYENSLHFSPRFQEYAEALANRLIHRYNLHDKQILEIGCGRGDFLNLLCELGENRGVGFDPSYVDDPSLGSKNTRTTFIRNFYSKRYEDHRADLICCRHVLEHLKFPRGFLLSLRQTIGNHMDTAVFFEVPNSRLCLRDSGIWDLIYEHYSYFSLPSLVRLFSSCGFEVFECAEAFDGQYLGIEAFPITREVIAEQDSDEDVMNIAQAVSSFAEGYHRQIARWQGVLAQQMAAGQRAVVWGSGSKGVTFLNTIQRQGQIEYVVDINPRKEGKYVAGTGQQIVSPQHLVEYQPEIILVMNPIYLDEIAQYVRDLNLSSKLIAVS